MLRIRKQKGFMMRFFKCLRPLVLMLTAVLMLTSCFGIGPDNPIHIYDQRSDVERWLDSLKGKTAAEQAVMAEQVWSSPKSSKELRNRAAYVLAARPGRQTSVAQHSLFLQYMNSNETQQKAMERTLYEELQSCDDRTLTTLARAVTKSQELAFPYSLTLWTAAKRGLLKNNKEMLDTLAAAGAIRDTGITGASGLPQPPVGTGDVVTALLLPGSGPAAATAQKIAEGAQAAERELIAAGHTVRVLRIDTEAPNWTDSVAALPRECVIIGGPLQTNRMTELANSGITVSRAVFAFLPRLSAPSTEGVNAWRFFTSPEDQIRTLIDIASTEMGITNYGVFAPSNRYGEGMADLFRSEAAMRGYSTSSASYTISDMNSLTQSAAGFLNYRYGGKTSLPVANVNFEAIFVPESWRNMELMVSTLNYHGAYKMVLLGPNLWEEGLASAKPFSVKDYALSVFPTSFSQEQNTPEMRKFLSSMQAAGAEANGWSALGYDFVKTAAGLGKLTAPLSPSELNARLSSYGGDFVGAPFSWDQDGHASRALLPAQPARGGAVLFDAGKFSRYRKGSGVLPNLRPRDLPDQDKNAAR